MVVFIGRCSTCHSLERIAGGFTCDGQRILCGEHIHQIHLKTVVQDKYTVLHVYNVSLHRNDHGTVVALGYLDIENVSTGLTIINRNAIWGSSHIAAGDYIALHIAKFQLGHRTQRGCRCNLLQKRTAFRQQSVDIGSKHIRSDTQTVTSPLIILRTGSTAHHHIDTVLIGTAGAVGLLIGSNVKGIGKAAADEIGISDIIIDASNLDAAAGKQSVTVHFLQISLQCVGAAIQSDQGGLAFLIGEVDLQIRSGESSSYAVEGLAAADGQTVSGVDSYAQLCIGKGEMIQVRNGVGRVAELKAILHILICVDQTAVVQLQAALVRLLIRIQIGVGNTDVGSNTHIGTGGVAFHIIEVERIFLAVYQCKRPVPVSGSACGNLSSGCIDIVVQIHIYRSGVVGTADIQNKLTIDEQINVIIAFKVEEQTLAFVVGEFAVALQDIVVVFIREICSFNLIRIVDSNLDTFRFPNRQECIMRTARCYLNSTLKRLTQHTGIEDGFRRKVVFDSTLCCTRNIVVGIREIGVKDIGGLTIGECRLGEHQIVKLVLGHIVGCRIEQIVQDEIGRIGVGRNVFFTLIPGADELILLAIGCHQSVVDLLSTRSRIIAVAE